MSRKLVSNSNHPLRTITRIQGLIAGFSKLSPSEQFDVLGTVEAAPGLLTDLQAMLAPYTASDDADLAAKKARDARDAAAPATLQRVEAIEKAVRSHYGSKSPDLVSFGLEPQKERRKPTPDERANIAAKAKATKDARRAALKATATPPPTPSTPPPQATTSPVPATPPAVPPVK
ncbi:MAG TPA: hypothetical protein VFF73_20005 [Planctomycetota bacterium]|nr:hypothetical protein [Planctomycetota bacterium]